MATDTDDLKFEVSGRVATLTLNRPEKLNALSEAMIAAGIEHLRHCAEDAAALLAEEPGTDLEGAPDALPELLLGGRLRLEGDRGLAHVGRVDREHRAGVGLVGEADDHHRRPHTQAATGTL